MQDSEIRAVFRRMYNGQTNFMTPGILGYGKRGKMVWELSYGEGLGWGTKLYGVTVIELPRTERHDLSQAFHSIDDAKAYIRGDFTNV